MSKTKASTRTGRPATKAKVAPAAKAGKAKAGAPAKARVVNPRGGKGAVVKSPAVAAKDIPARPEPARVRQIIAHLEVLYPDVHCELDHRDAFQLLTATIMSAQTTDARVNMVTPHLFARYPDANALAKADQADVERIIHSTGFYRNKAKNIIGMARALVERHGGQVPRTMDEMLALPGVARKTANVVLGTAYGIPSGIAVDTHVQRLSRLLGLTRETDPVKIEKDLMDAVPREAWIDFSHRVIWHGRRVCIANRPKCGECPLPCPSRQTV